MIRAVVLVPTLYSIAPWVPFASVRRNIQELRRAGYNINDARDNNGLYRLVA